MSVFLENDFEKLDPEFLKSRLSKEFSQRLSITTYRFNPDYLYRGGLNWNYKNNTPIDFF